jgi:hypothetical protein
MRIRGLASGTLLALIALSQPLLGQELQPARRGDLGVRYWLSTGETQRSHNAQIVDPSLGNPTSVLLYDNLDAHVFELFGRQNFAGAFIKGFLGIGRVNVGLFDDEDFRAGQVKFSDTTSPVTEGRIGYGTIDIGRNAWILREGRTTLGVFVGYSQWTESVDAFGAKDHLGFIGGDIPTDIKVITNKAIWKSLRVGLAAELALGARSRLELDLAFIPYSKVRDEDSHHLRPDLGPVPNIILEGRGRGVMLDAELTYEIARRVEFGLGARYWHLEATRGTRSVPNIPGAVELPLVELYSIRYGVTASIRRIW